MPSIKDSKLKFINYRRQIKAPLIIYADFECILKPINESYGSCTEGLQDHIPCGFAYKLICNYNDSYTKDIACYRHESAEDCVSKGRALSTQPLVAKFIAALLVEEEYCKEIMKKDLNKYSSIDDMIITPEQEKEFEESTTCHICKGTYNEKDNNRAKPCRHVLQTLRLGIIAI